MALRLRSAPAAFLLGGSAALLAASFFRLWTVCHIGEWESVGHHETLWVVLWATVGLSRTPARCGDLGDLILAAIICAIGACIGGWLFYFAAWWRGPPLQ